MTSQKALPEIGQRLCAVRLNRGFSQGMLARRVGISASYLSRIENGKIQPTFRTVTRILRGLKVGFEEVLPSDEVRGRKGACPVSRQGHCLLDLVGPETVEGGHGDEERYSPRQLRLLRRVAAWMIRAQPDRIRAMEALFDDLLQAVEPQASSGRRAPRSR